MQPQPGSRCATALTETSLSVCPARWDPGQPSSSAASVYLGQAPVQGPARGGPGDRAGAPFPPSMVWATTGGGNGHSCPRNARLTQPPVPPRGGLQPAGGAPHILSGSQLAPRGLPLATGAVPHFQMFGRAAPPWPQAGRRALLGRGVGCSCACRALAGCCSRPWHVGNLGLGGMTSPKALRRRQGWRIS